MSAIIRVRRIGQVSHAMPCGGASFSDGGRRRGPPRGKAWAPGSGGTRGCGGRTPSLGQNTQPSNVSENSLERGDRLPALSTAATANVFTPFWFAYTTRFVKRSAVLSTCTPFR
jgi:hypothetical protein